MEKSIQDSLLLDFYEDLLTDKQKEVMRLYVNCDVSLSEIADQLSQSRQAIYDTVKNAYNQLELFEEKLGLVKKFLQEKKVVEEVLSDIDSLGIDNKKTQNIKNKLKKLLKN